MEDEVVLVDADDRPVGTSPKLAAHRSGLLHRAFSVFVFDAAGRLLLQQRSATKYHSAGLWSNTCCGHPRPGEDLVPAARRRLQEEMGFSCELADCFAFQYRCRFPNGLEEHEIDHVCLGRFDGPVSPDPSEVSHWEWMDVDHLLDKLRHEPALFSFWLTRSFERVLDHPACRELTGR